MAQVERAPRSGIEDEMVGAAMQISLLRQEVKSLKLAVATSHDEIANLKKTVQEKDDVIQHQASERREASARHESEMEDMRKNELEAVETARKAFAELEKRNADVEKLKAALSEAQSYFQSPVQTRARELEQGQGQAASPIPGEKLSKKQSQSPSPSPGPSAKGVASSPEGVSGKPNGGSSRYSLGEDDDEEDDEDGKRVGGGGLFGWLTGSSRKKRRREE